MRWELVELDRFCTSVILVPEAAPCGLVEPVGWSSPSEMPANTGVHYTARKIMYGTMIAVEYLAPADWPDDRAMRWQFGK